MFMIWLRLLKYWYVCISYSREIARWNAKFSSSPVNNVPLVLVELAVDANGATSPDDLAMTRRAHKPPDFEFNRGQDQTASCCTFPEFVVDRRGDLALERAFK